MGQVTQINQNQSSSLLSEDSLVKALQRIEAKISMNTIEPGEWVLPSIITARFGINEPSLKKYRYCGLWLEGIHFIKNPANRIVYSPRAIDLWMSGGS